MFRLGRYTGLRGPGLFWLIPLGIENETRIDLRVVTAPIEQQETITRDSVTINPSVTPRSSAAWRVAASASSCCRPRAITSACAMAILAQTPAAWVRTHPRRW